MQFALVNGIKTEAMPGGKGICPCCESETIAKCGKYKIWHWSHKSQKNCDSWWENETEWHRQWKSYFPIENQEVVHKDIDSGEKHIADVKTFNGMVIEFQNSPINVEELKARENF
jgi:competence CoiA-like predicted nuclease